ncbi:type IV secretion system protein, partial [Bradyrhizobium brasilense]|uniref:type IV secretion system protein n=1 Tax=Bradyrhizobium brasilense TaxID=1419277 RepID=UPI001E3C15AF
MADSTAVKVVQVLMSGFEQPLTNYATSTVSNVASAVSGPLTVGAVLYVVLFGMFTATGRVQAPMSQFVWDCVRIAVIILLATQADNYNTYVNTFFYKTLPEEVGGLLVASGSSFPADSLSSGAGFDAIINRIIDSGTKIADKAGWDVATKLFGYLFLGVGVIVIALISVVLLFAKVGLAMMVAIGPIFIGLSLFTPTRSYTSSWISQLMNFTILQILVYALFGLILTLVDNTVRSVATSADLSTAYVAASAGLGVFILSLVVASQLPSIAASLSGGGVALGSSLMGAAITP